MGRNFLRYRDKIYYNFTLSNQNLFLARERLLKKRKENLYSTLDSHSFNPFFANSLFSKGILFQRSFLFFSLYSLWNFKPDVGPAVHFENSRFLSQTNISEGKKETSNLK